MDLKKKYQQVGVNYPKVNENIDCIKFGSIPKDECHQIKHAMLKILPKIGSWVRLVQNDGDFDIYFNLANGLKEKFFSIIKEQVCYTY